MKLWQYIAVAVLVTFAVLAFVGIQLLSMPGRHGPAA
jgi:hypothetical protein